MEIADVYCRKSTADQGRSVASQETECRQAIEREGWSVGRIFVDDGLSASRYARKARESYGNLVEHLRSGQCQVLVLWEASRGSRDLGEWATFLDLCRRHRVLLHIVTHRRTYDVTRRRDWKTLAEEGLDAADESERISERTQRGKRAAALDGRPAGKLLYGYRRVYDDRGNYVEQVEHPERAEVIRQAARAVLAGEPLSSIARRLNDQGVPSPGGGRWRGTHLGRMLCNPAYAARRIHQGQDIGPGAWPAILDAETFRMLVDRLSDPNRRTQRGTALRHYLSGVPVCHRDGARMRTHGSGKARTYVCRECHRTAITADSLDLFVGEVVCARLRRPDAADLFAPPVDDAALRDARQAEAELRLRLDAMYDQAAAGSLSADGLARMEARLLPQIDAAAERVRRLSTPPALRALAGVDIPGRWGELSPTTRRDVVTALVDVLHIGPPAPGTAAFDPGRLAGSRWRGDPQTWGELGLLD